MVKNEEPQGNHAAEVLKRNIEESRKLLDAKKRKNQARGGAESPLEDDPIHADGHVPSQEPINSRGSTGGQRNMGGGRRKTG